MSTPYVDVTTLLNQVMPLISVFITIFIMVWIFKSLKDMFAGIA